MSSTLDYMTHLRALNFGYKFVERLENYVPEIGVTLFYSSNAIYYVSQTLSILSKPGDLIFSIGHIYDPKQSLGSIGL